MKILFWLSLFLIVYTYAGYPLLLFFWSRVFPNLVDKAYQSSYPMVSVVIAAHNEEKNILNRIENILEQTYPPDKMEVIVVSDGSTDSTNEIMAELIRKKTVPELKLITLDQSLGKPNALNIGVKQSVGEFIVFTDTRQVFEPNAIKELISNFNDPTVGCVSGELVFYNDGNTSIQAEMGFYWNLEKHIRKMESKVKSVVGATGAIYAIRRNLYEPIEEHVLIDDVLIPMNVVFRGYRTVFDSKAVAYDIISKDMSQEQKRKKRTLLGNYRILKIKPQLILPWRNPIFIEYVSHKVLRLGVPFFYLLFIISAYLIDGLTYKLAFMGGLGITVLPVLDKIVPEMPYLGEMHDKIRKKVNSILNIFVSLNFFALMAFLYFIWPRRVKIW